MSINTLKETHDGRAFNLDDAYFISRRRSKSDPDVFEARVINNRQETVQANMSVAPQAGFPPFKQAFREV